MFKWTAVERYVELWINECIVQVKAGNSKFLELSSSFQKLIIFEILSEFGFCLWKILIYIKLWDNIIVNLKKFPVIFLKHLSSVWSFGTFFHTNKNNFKSKLQWK